ncbi:MAG TPA: nucleotide exchange factor GrpE [Solirubrobacterales bacterium]|nr:nucleotide exchange factor GrpE [Solirubrobacterales bacterium]
MIEGSKERGAERPDAGPPGGDQAGPGGDHPSPTPPPPAPSAEEADRVEADLEGLLKERDDYLELAKRTKADFENFRKRMTGELRDMTARGKGELARDLVSALDDLERAIEAAGLDPDGDSEDGLSHGVLLVFRSLRDTLARHGIETVDPGGERFDPTVHEALSLQASEGVEPGTIVEVLQKGYRLGDQLIRPARVVVGE